MPHTQSGIIPDPNQSALFLILRVKDPEKMAVQSQKSQHVSPLYLIA